MPKKNLQNELELLRIIRVKFCLSYDLAQEFDQYYTFGFLGWDRKKNDL